MIHGIQFGDAYPYIRSKDYSCVMLEARTEDVPERKCEYFTVPGRSGSFVQDLGTYEDVDITYKFAITSNFQANYTRLINDLMGLAGRYHQLVDTVSQTDEYRMAVFVGPVEPVMAPYNKSGTFTLKFRAMPQRWLFSGGGHIEITAGGTLINNNQPSKPLIDITGTGPLLLSVGDYLVAVSDIKGHITLDCELCNAYDGPRNRNGDVVTGGPWPQLAPGTNTIAVEGSGVTKISVTPRWWRL